ncbi:MAG: hypothetical protein U7126_20925 [Microcoleus sp.]
MVEKLLLCIPDGSLLFTEEANNRIDRVQVSGVSKGRSTIGNCSCG